MPLPAVLLLSLLPLQADAPQEERPFPEGGFAITAPAEGWTVGEASESAAGYSVPVRLTSSGGTVALGVLTNGVPDDASAGAVRDGAIRTLEARAQYDSHALLEARELDGLEAAGVDITWKTDAAGEVRSRLWYVVADGEAWLLSAQAPVATWSEHENAFERFFSGFRRIERAAEDPRAARIEELAARCGSELDWAADWAEASRRAKAEGRHVLAVVRSYPGFDIPDATRTSTFMDEDLVALLRAEVVPLRLESGMDSPMKDAAIYGMGPNTFGTALLLCDASGKVLADTSHYRPAAALRWMWTELERHPRPGKRVDPADPYEAALARARRGEAAAVLEELRALAPGLEGVERGRAALVLARTAMLLHEGQIALWCLEAAEKGDPALSAEVGCLRALALIASGDTAGARKALGPALEDPEDADFPRALFLKSSLDQLEGSVADARPDRERLVDEFPESRWAWLAAAFLENESFLELSATKKPRLAWPDEAILALVAEPLPAPVGVEASAQARLQGLTWLAAARSQEGGWPSLDELGLAEGDVPGLITCAVDALAARALLAEGDEHRAGAAGALAHLLDVDRRRRERNDPPLYMDYTGWAAWAQLELVAEALEAKVGDADDLRAFGSRLVGDLEDRVRKNGGWSYYLSGDAEGANAVEQSISFTTAAVVIGLHRARAAGVEVPPALIDGALDCLEAMRSESGLFAYMLHHPSGAAQHGAPVGAAGRGPACELALFLGGRSSVDRLGHSIDLFTQHAGGLSGEVGKALMHAGEGGVGCHYPFFDYLMAARAAQHLPESRRRPFGLMLEELVLQARLEDGSFQDTPLLGRAFGTAAALETLRLLGR